MTSVVFAAEDPGEECDLDCVEGDDLVCCEIDCGNYDIDPGDCEDEVGANPVRPHRASVIREVEDIRTFGAAPIRFKRVYQSRHYTSYNERFTDFGGRGTQSWQHNWNFEMRHRASSFGHVGILLRYPEGREERFAAIDHDGLVLVPSARNGDRLYPWEGPASEHPPGYTLVTPAGLEFDFERTRNANGNWTNRFKLIEKRDGRGGVWLLTHDSDERIRRITNCHGDWLEIDRATVHDKTAVTGVHTSDGRAVDYSYALWEEADRSYPILREAQYPCGAVAFYDWVNSHPTLAARPLLAAARDPMYSGAGSRVRYTYNHQAVFDFGNGPYNVLGVVQSEMNYDTHASLVELPLGAGARPRVIDGGGTAIGRVYQNGRMVQRTDGMGHTFSRSYGAGGAGYIVGTVDALGGETLYDRDYAGRVTQLTRPDLTTVNRAYNTAGFLVSVTDERGHERVITRNALNQRERVDYPDNTYETFTYNTCGQILTHRQRSGNTITRQYNAAGLVAQEDDGMGNITLFTYHDGTGPSPAGLLKTRTDPLGHTTEYTYDPRGNITRIDHSDETWVEYTYDAYGNRLSETNELGHTTTFVYNEYNQVIERTDPLGRTTKYEYGTSPGCSSCAYRATLTRVETPAGRVTEHKYNANGWRIRTVEAPGTPEEAVTEFTHDAMGRLTGRRDANGHWTTFTRDIMGRVLFRHDPDGTTTGWTYDAAGKILTETRPGDAVTSYVYDEMNRVISVTDPEESETLFAHDDAGNLLKKTDPLLRETTYTYDGANRRTGALYPGNVAYTWAYDDAGRLEVIEDPYQNPTTFTHDARGRRTGVSDPLDRETEREYAAAGRLTEIRFPGGAVHTFVYNAAGELTEKDEDGAVTTYAYDPDGLLILRTDPAGAQTHYTYDARGRLLTETDDLGRVTSYTYDPVGNLLVESRPGGVVTVFTYDAMNRLLTVTDANEETITYAYTPRGRLHTLSDTRAAVTTWSYNARDQVTAKTYHDAFAETMTYDAAGNLATFTTARGVVRTYTYDERDRLTAVTYDDGLTPGIEFAYDARGLRTLARRLDGAAVLSARAFTYDDAGALLAEEWTHGPLAGVTVSRAYDASSGFLASLSVEQGASTVLAHAYAHSGAKVLSATDTLHPGAPRAEYAYDAARRLAATAFTTDTLAPVTVARQYDAVGRLASVTSPVGGHTYTYDTAGRRTAAALDDGGHWSYAYDALGQVTGAARYDAAGAPVPGHDFAYSYDPMGNRLAARRNTLETAYTANLLNQYTQRTVPAGAGVTGKAAEDATVTVDWLSALRSGQWFHIDVPMDNSAADLFETLGVTGVVAADKDDPAPVNYVETAERDIFLPQNPETFIHDADGNLLRDGRWEYTWDGENRLIAMETRADLASALPRKRVAFTYDTDGRRLRKQTAGWDAASQTFVPAADTRFVHNQWNLLAEIDGGAAVLRSYLWGASPDGRLETTATPGALAGYRDHGTGAFHFAQADGNGNITHLIDAADGSLSGRYTYGAFGEPLAAEGDAARANPLRFSSKYTDASTGLVYYGYRFYDPSNGRWLNRDPIGEAGHEAVKNINRHHSGRQSHPEGEYIDDLNPYGFVFNNAVMLYDKTGEAVFIPVIYGVAKGATWIGARIGIRAAVRNYGSAPVAAAVVSEMARPKRNLENEIVREIRERLRQKGGDPCKMLRKMADDLKVEMSQCPGGREGKDLRKNLNKELQKVKEAMKEFDCKRHHLQ